MSHPYHQLLSPRLSELSPGGHNTDLPSAGGIPSIALAPPAAAFMASPSILGAFQPYSPLLPMMAETKSSKKFYFKCLHCDLDVYILTVWLPVIITNTTYHSTRDIFILYTGHFCFVQI
jgi:hypothetical protein